MLTLLQVWGAPKNNGRTLLTSENSEYVSYMDASNQNVRLVGVTPVDYIKIAEFWPRRPLQTKTLTSTIDFSRHENWTSLSLLLSHDMHSKQLTP